MKAILTHRPSAIWLFLFVNTTAALYLCHLGMPGGEATWMMFPAVVVLSFLYAALKRGKISLRMDRSSLAQDPKGFWNKFYFGLFFYALVSVVIPWAAAIRHARLNNWG
jgi:hypothetical protein